MLLLDVPTGDEISLVLHCKERSKPGNLLSTILFTDEREREERRGEREREREREIEIE